MIDCSVCGWRHIVPCGRDDCPHDAATHYATIARALDNALANGCAEELSKMSDEDIAYDLARLEAGCERLPIEILKAGVRAWRLPQNDPEPSDEEVNAAINALADSALRKVTGSSGHAWGARAQILRDADLLKRALATRPKPSDEGAADEASGATD